MREKAEHPHWSDILGRGLAAISVGTTLVLVLWTWVQGDARLGTARRYQRMWWPTWHDTPVDMFARRLSVSAPILVLILVLVVVSAYQRCRLHLIAEPEGAAERISWINLAHLWALQLLLLDLVVRLMISQSYFCSCGGGTGSFPFDAVFGNAVAGVPTLTVLLLMRIGLRRYEVPEGYRSRVLFRVGLVSVSSSIAAVNMCLWSVAY